MAIIICGTMGRIVRDIEVEGRPAVALFDTGSMRSYVRRALVPAGLARSIPEFKVGLGGEERVVKEGCILRAEIDGLEFELTAFLMDNLGKIDGRELDLIIGATTMEEWEIRVDPRSGALDLTALRRREFTEYF